MLDLAALDRIDRALAALPCRAPQPPDAQAVRPQPAAAARQGCPCHIAEGAA
jgi:hypothetical protein